jgi:DNA-binding FadR family transcriptional regulator
VVLLKFRAYRVEIGCVSIAPHQTVKSATSGHPMPDPAAPAEPFRRTVADLPPSPGDVLPRHSHAWEPAEHAVPVARKSGAGRGRGLHGQLVQQLGQMIVAGEIGADRPLVPEEIGQRFEVSRTVVRESLRVLEAKGLVSARPNVGTRVRPVADWNLLDPDVIDWRACGPQRDAQRRELFELRWGIEPLAAHMAACRNQPEVITRLGEVVDVMHRALAQPDPMTFSRADAEFHHLLLQVAGNRMLEHLAQILSTALQISGAPVTGCEHLSESSVALHARLVDAVEAGDGEGAESAMRQLLAVHPEVDRLFPAPREG